MRSPTITAALLALAASSPALADGTDAAATPVETRHISFADLDLASTAGERILIDRVRFAATSVCVDIAIGPDLARRLAQRRCVEDVMNGAMAQIETAVASAQERKAGSSLAGR